MKHASHAAVVALLEPLEQRRLLSSVTLTGTTLKIIGDPLGSGPNNGHDELTITRNNTGIDQYVVRLNGDNHSFNVSAVSLIRISTLTGDDRIEISDASGTIAARRFVTAGNGDDTIFSTGGGRETLRGSSGDDVIRGSVGNDVIEGNGGRDSLFGDTGNDQIFGGRGNDSINGGDGRDLLYGDAANDTLSGGDGRDVLAGDSEDQFRLSGQPAPDTVIGDDELIGGADDDTLLAHTGTDTLTGNTGDDVFDARRDDATLVDRNASEIVPNEVLLNGTPVITRTINLSIIIDGDDGLIPDDAGNLPAGAGNTVAVGNDGVIRFRDIEVRAFQLGEFFQAWGVTFDNRHIGRFAETSELQLRMRVNGTNNTSFANYQIQNGDDIVIRLS